MIGPEVRQSRYPDPPAAPRLWCGWRRLKGGDAPWERVPGSDSTTKGGCYQWLMQHSELANLPDGTGKTSLFEYLILPAGAKPEFAPGPGQRR